MISPPPFRFAWNSRNINVQWCAAVAVRRAAALLGERSLARSGAYEGVMRTPAPGSWASGVADRITIGVVDAPLFGRTKLPTKAAPAASAMTSPGCAALIAA